jgi:penicillin-binding protein 2
MAPEKHGYRIQDRLFKSIIIICFVVLTLRLFQLQVLSGSVYRDWSDRNRIRQITLTPQRGRIVDRNGRLLVGNRPSYSLFIVPYEFKKNLADALFISSQIGLPIDQIQSRIQDAGGGPFTPVRLIRDMDFETLSRIEENRLDLPGVFFEIEPVRTYSNEIRISHVLGYVGEINHQELQLMPHQQFFQGDFIGKSGVERRYNDLLWGQRGYRYVEVDVRGREVGNFEGVRDIPAVSGRDLMLTLDSDLQKHAETCLEGKRGAIVVLNPQNGDILAMVSKPDYSLDPFNRGISQAVWNRIREDPGKPLLHRAIQSQLPPGSTYKLILTAAALFQRDFDPEEEVFCSGSFILGRRPFHCWENLGHGYVGLLDAIQFSCNVYFYRLGLQVGIDQWSRFGHLFGFGDETGIDLPNEKEGLLPDRRFLDEKYGKGKWTRGMVVNLSVGQGDLLVTPIQMVQLISRIALDGELVQPHVLKAVMNPLSKEWEAFQSVRWNLRAIPPNIYQMIKEGMYRVVQYPGGTGRAARISKLEICGKTGTAQNPRGMPHAWFAGFAPRENPLAVVVVVIENSGSGGAIAAPIAGRLFNEIFKQEKPP